MRGPQGSKENRNGIWAMVQVACHFAHNAQSKAVLSLPKCSRRDALKAVRHGLVVVTHDLELAGAAEQVLVAEATNTDLVHAGLRVRRDLNIVVTHCDAQRHAHQCDETRLNVQSSLHDQLGKHISLPATCILELARSSNQRIHACTYFQHRRPCRVWQTRCAISAAGGTSSRLHTHENNQGMRTIIGKLT